MQNMLLKLQKYNLKVVYKNGKDTFIAHTLSRAYNDKPVKEEQFEYEVMTVETATHMLAPSSYNELIDSTAADEVLSKLTTIIKQGTWPSRFTTTPS